ncbi:MAG TPA: hypothetical protein VJN96_16770 [Vicinamibacterales bacterium]|nr:hypothetical protein [Vicinamibacterales bacterium]
MSRVLVGIAMTVIAALMTAPARAAAAETWGNVPVVDVSCHTKAKDNPDAHTRECGLQCATSGFGLIAADGTFLKFDKAGNDKAVAALKASKAKDHVRATVTGERKGDTITVQTIELK